MPLSEIHVQTDSGMLACISATTGYDKVLSCLNVESGLLNDLLFHSESMRLAQHTIQYDVESNTPKL
jgi:hypothetical protein